MIMIFKDVNGIIIGVVHRGADETTASAIARFTDRKYGKPLAGSDSFKQEMGNQISITRSFMKYGVVLSVEKFDDSAVVIA